MQSKYTNSKYKQDDDAFGIVSKTATPKSLKHLDYRLQERELDFIRSKLPQNFYLLNPKTDERAKIEARLRHSNIETQHDKNKKQVVQQKKNAKKHQSEIRRTHNSVDKKQKSQENDGEGPFYELQKGKIGYEYSQKLAKKETHIQADADAQKMEVKPAENIGLLSKNNIDINYYLMEQSWIEKQKQKSFENYQSYEAMKNGFGYEQRIPQNEHFYGKIGENIGFNYGVFNPQETQNFVNFYSIPLLESGMPRYDPVFFQPRPDESQEKNHLLRIFGLPFAETLLEPVQKLSDVQKNFCLNFLHRLKSHKSSQIFRIAVNPEGQEIPDYYHIVYQPMDLQTIQKKVLKDKYSGIHEFHADINKIIMSSYKYNLRETPYFFDTVRFEDYYHSLLREVKTKPQDFAQDYQQKASKVKKVEDNQFFDEAEMKKKKKADSMYEAPTQKKERSKGLARTKSTKYFEESSNILYNSMINESNNQFHHENIFNPISEENTKKNKKNPIFPKKHSTKKNDPFFFEEQNHVFVSGPYQKQLKNQSNQKFMEIHKQIQAQVRTSEEENHLKKSLREGMKFLDDKEKTKRPRANIKASSYEKGTKKSEKSIYSSNFQKKQNVDSFRNNGQDFQFDYEESKMIESDSDLNKQEIYQKKIQPGSAADNFEVNDKSKKNLFKSPTTGENVEVFQVHSENQVEPTFKEANNSIPPISKEYIASNNKAKDGEFLEFLAVRQSDPSKIFKSIPKQEEVWSNKGPIKNEGEDMSEVHSRALASNSPLHLVSGKLSFAPMPLTSSAKLSKNRKSKKKDQDEDYKLEEEEQFYDNRNKSKGKFGHRQQSSYQNQSSYSQEYGVPKNRKKISKKQINALTAKINEAKPAPVKAAQDEMQAIIRAEMQNFYIVPEIQSDKTPQVSTPTPSFSNFPSAPLAVAQVEEKPEVENKQVLPVPFSSSIFMEKEDQEPEAFQGIDFMDFQK